MVIKQILACSKHHNLQNSIIDLIEGQLRSSTLFELHVGLDVQEVDVLERHSRRRNELKSVFEKNKNGSFDFGMQNAFYYM